MVVRVGAHNAVVGADQGFRAPSWGLMCRILHRFLALLVRLAVRKRAFEGPRDHRPAAPARRAAPPRQPTAAHRLGPDPAGCHRGAPRPASGTQRPLRPSASLSYPAPPLTPANAVAGPLAVPRLHQLRFAISEIRFTAQIPTLEDRCNFNDLRLTHRPHGSVSFGQFAVVARWLWCGEPTGSQPSGRGRRDGTQQRQVLIGERWTVVLSAQDCELVAQHHDFEVLRASRAHSQAGQRHEQPVQNATHGLPGCKRIMPGQRARPNIGHPHVVEGGVSGASDPKPRNQRTGSHRCPARGHSGPRRPPRGLRVPETRPWSLTCRDADRC